MFRIDGMNVIFTWETVVVVCVGEGGGANYHYLRPRALAVLWEGAAQPDPQRFNN